MRVRQCAGYEEAVFAGSDIEERVRWAQGRRDEQRSPD